MLVLPHTERLLPPSAPAEGAAGTPARVAWGAWLRHSRTRTYLALAALVLGGSALTDASGLHSWRATEGTDLLAMALMLAGLAYAARHAPADRPPWRWILAGSALILLGELVFNWETEIQGGDGLISAADVFYLAGHACWITGLAVLDRRHFRRSGDLGALDALVVAVTVAGIFVVLGARPGIDPGASPLAAAVNLAYPIAGFAILWLLLANAFLAGISFAPWRALLALGFVLYASMESFWVFTLNDDLSLPWAAAALCLGAAGVAAVEAPDVRRPSSARSRWLTEALPVTAFALFGITGAATLALSGGRNVGDELVAVVAVFAAITIRLVSTVRQNRRLLAEGARREAELIVARRAAESADRAKSSFLATMSHELRTPLSAIIGGAELLEDSELAPEDRRKLIHTVGTAGDALLAVINDVLDFSKIEAGRFTLERVPFDPREVVSTAVEVLSGAAEAKGLQLTTIIQPELPMRIVGDPARLRQILLNLLSNAVKFTPAGEIRVHASADVRGSDCTLELAVADTGPGIAPEAQRRLFAPFEQEGADVARRHGGTGLGLAISRRLAELMGGELTVASALGAGATFICRVPTPIAAAAATTAEEEFGPAPSWARPLRILVVDDDAVNRDLAMAMLTRLGRRADDAPGGSEALRMFARGGYDAALVDLRMPGIDGFELARRVRAMPQARGLHLIALSADVTAATLQHCRNAGFDDHLAKPVRLESLESALAVAVAPSAVARADV